MNGSFTYLDCNATVPVRSEVADAVTSALSAVGNPSSVHRHGRLARAAVERARESVAGFIGAEPQTVIFTSGGTEANNLAIQGLMKGYASARLMVSAVEHDSVYAFADADVYRCDVIPVSKGGVVDLGELDTRLKALQGERAVLSVMLANNETGVIQPVADVVELAKEHNVLVHCDAIQAVGKIDVNFAALGVDALSVSAHKFGGPQGVGALVIRGGIAFEKLSFGGGQEMGRRAGTENLPGIVGFGRAADVAHDDKVHLQRVGSWRDGVEREIGHVASDAIFYGRDQERLVTTTCFGVPGWPAETQVIALDLAGVSVSAGSACSSGKVGTSHVLTAMGASSDEAASAIRVSFGWNSREEDAKRFVEIWTQLYKRHRDRTGRKSA